MSETKKALNKLIDRESTWYTKLDETAPATPIPASRGVGRPAAGNSAAAGGGISSPLKEKAYSDRTYYEDYSLETSDGIFTLIVKPVKTLTFYDAAGEKVVFEFEEPT